MIRRSSRTLFHCPLHLSATSPWVSHSTHIQDGISVLQAGPLIRRPSRTNPVLYLTEARCLRHLRRPYTTCTRNTGMKTSGKPAQGSSLMKRFRSFPMFVASTH